MGKVRRVEERLVANDLDCEGKSQLFGCDAEEKSIFIDQLLDMIDGLIVFTHAELFCGNMLEMGLMGCMKPFEQKQQPCNSAFEKSDAQTREAVEDAVVNHVRTVDRESPGMTEGVDRHVHVHMVHAESIVRSAMDGQTAT